jgi:DNA-binding XRE family transcriptional regulator
MKTARRGNHIRHYRKKSGLSQQELGRILGYLNEGAVSRHEQSKTIPPLLTAMAYEAVFHIPITELFPGLHSSVEQAIRQRILELESELHERLPKTRRSRLMAQKLSWLDEHRAFYES